MAQQTIGIGTAVDDGTGDPLRTAFDKTNQNFTDLYSSKVSKSGDTMTGVLQLVSGNTANPGLAFSAQPSTGFFYNGSGDTIYSANGVNGVRLTGGNVVLGAGGTGGLYFASSGVSIGATAPALWYDGAAGALAQRNGTQAQAFRVYNTWTDASNYERAYLAWSAGLFTLGTEVGGTGTIRSIMIKAANNIRFQAGNFESWNISSSGGHFIAAADNTYDIGAIAANRPRNGYFSNSVVIGFSSTSTAQLHVGAGADLDIYNGALGSLSPQIINSQTSGAAAIGAAVYDGTFNRRVGLFVDNTNSIWGLSLKYSSTTIPFVIIQSGVEQLRLDTSGNLGLGNPTAITYRLDVKGSYQTIVSRFLRSADYGEVIRLGRDGVAGSAGIGYPADDTISLLTSGIERVRVSGAGHLLAGADATYDQGAVASGRFRDYYASRTVYAGTSVLIGGTAPAGATSLASLQSFGTGWALIGGSSVTNATNKTTGIGGLHYLAAEKPLTMMVGFSTSTASTVYVGGGVSSGHAATDLIFVTSATTTGGAGTGRWGITSAGALYPVADAAYDFGAASAQARDAYLSRRLLIGGAAPAGAASLGAVQAFGSTFALIGAHTNLTDATDKAVRIGGLHYLAAEEPIMLVYGYGSVGGNTVAIGGGSSVANAATEVQFWTAANNTTVTGTGRWYISSSGNFAPFTTAAYDAGLSGARIRTVFANIFDASSGTITASAPALNIAQTWNNGAVNFTGALINVTNTAAAVGSLIQDWQVAGVSRFAIASESGSNFIARASQSGVDRVWMRTASSGAAIEIYSAGLNSYFGFGTLGSTDTNLFREGGGQLALRNSVTAQSFRVYNTYTDASNYERGRFAWSGNVLCIGPEAAGTGTVRELQIASGASLLHFASGGVNTTGGLTAFINASRSTSGMNTTTFATTGTLSQGTSGLQYGLGVQNTINQGGTAGYTALLINVTETATGSGAKLLQDWQVGSTSKAKMDNTGLLTVYAVTTGPVAVASLPAAGVAGRRMAVTDALAPTFGTAVVGGGAVNIPVYDNGTAWVAA